MSAVTGVRPLLKVTVRQDGRNIAPWIVLITALSASSVLAYAWVFPDQESRRHLAATLGTNPALSLVFGQARDLMTADGFNAWRAGALGTFFAALMAVFIVVRNSRADEDSGQAELLASGVMGRHTRLATAVALGTVASLALGAVSWLVTLAFGGGAVDSLALSSTFTASGLMFTGVAAVAAQIGSDARTANTLAVAVLGIAFIARGYIDAAQAPEWTAWLTPLGWLGQVKAAAGNEFWALLPALVLAVVLIAFAFALNARRDFGMGLIPPRRGPARGGRSANVWGLALRLNRGPILSWLVAFAGLGTIFGFLAGPVGDVFAEGPGAFLAASAGAGPEDLLFGFVAQILQIIAIIAAVFGVQIVMRVYAEETDYRVEPLLAGSLRRATYLTSNAVLAFLAPALGMLLAGGVLGLVVTRTEPAISAVDVLGQAAVTVPAVWVLVALALAAVGANPRVRLVGWLGIVATFALTLLGPLFRLWDWILGISPLAHVPNLTAADPDRIGLLWITLIAVAFTAVAFAGFRRRDVL
ncbi:ABC-2 type transport system permease protein [Actinocorallia herbida]|uniref:ABC-2 type transport system permease protein n=1 Tax=Actinocorallia herbida TaxID=58109 RepID=A0A3N1CZT8_9ACTN|nr:multidrug ABC transporter permease [Actinocorallia herbida]ROO86791.1 ABC-2 type transport system permease protein [Actinocorallia herbida]